MTGVVGTWELARLVLRRDRVRLSIWLVVLTGLLAFQVAGIEEAYPEPGNRVTYATVMSGNAAARFFGSPDGTSLGAITMVEIYATLAVLTSIMCSMGIVRHTRRNEEAGRAELVGATVVGRHAGLVAALFVYCAAMLAYVATATGTLVALGLPVAGSALMAASLAGTGIVFAGIAAVSSQVAGGARLANGIAGMMIGAAFLFRAWGSVGGTQTQDGLGVVIAWPAWLSPIAWGDLAYPFTAQRWWALIGYPIAFAALVCVAVVLSSRRDLGRGMIPDRPGRPNASPALSNPFGLAVRLQRGLWIAWAAGAAVLGVSTGLFTDAFDDLFAENEVASELFAAVGGSDAMRDNAFAVMMTWTALMLVVYAVQSMLRLRGEEGRTLESVLATSTGRITWMASHVVVALVGASLLLVVAGLCAGASAVIVSGDRTLFGELVGAALVQVPAVMLVASTCALAYGLSPRLAAPVGWGAFALCLFTLLGDMFRLPEEVLELSPFAHVPLLPAEPFSATPLLWMLAGSGIALAGGAMLLKRRDIACA